MSKYRSEDLRDRFGLSYETIRRYALDFAEFLSEGAKPEEGKHRIYNDSDLRVFSVIVAMKTTNHDNDEIKETLKAGAEGRLEELLGDEPILSPIMERAIGKQEIANLKFQLEEVVKWRDIAQEQKGRISELEKQIEALKSNGRDELLMEIGRLKALLELAKAKIE